MSVVMNDISVGAGEKPPKSLSQTTLTGRSTASPAVCCVVLGF